MARFRNGSVGADGLCHAVPLGYENDPVTVCWRGPVDVQLGWFHGTDDGACPDCALRVALTEVREYCR